MEQHEMENKSNQVSLKYVIPIILSGGMFIGFSPALAHGAVVLWQKVTGYFSTVSLILLAIIWILLAAVAYFAGERFDALKNRVLKTGIIIAAILFSLCAGISMHLGRSWYYNLTKIVPPAISAPTVVYQSVPVPYPVYTPAVAIPEYPYTDNEQSREARCRTTCRSLIGYNWGTAEQSDTYSQCVSNCCESDN